MEEGAGTKNSPTTKKTWRWHLGTGTYPQPIKFEERCEDLKSFISNCSGGSNTDQYSTLMKEVSEYKGKKFSYGLDIKRYLEKKIKTRVP